MNSLIFVFVFAFVALMTAQPYENVAKNNGSDENSKMNLGSIVDMFGKIIVDIGPVGSSSKGDESNESVTNSYESDENFTTQTTQNIKV